MFISNYLEPGSVARGGNHDAAVSYARDHGFYVVPIHHIADDGSCSCGGTPGCRPGKHPLWRNWTNRATNDPDAVSAIWSESPDAGVGVLCGRASGVVVLDVDPRNGGNATLEAFVDQQGEPPSTPKAFTGGGGRHFFFSYPADPCRTRVLGPGLELRADDALVVLAPTKHASGERYGWDPDANLSNVALAPLPGWLTPIEAPAPSGNAADLCDIGRRKRRARAYLSTMEPAVSGKGGDAQTWRAVLATTVGFALDGDDALDALSGFNTRCVPPWASTELRRKVQAATGSPLRRGYLLDAEGEDDGAISFSVKRRDGSPESCAANVVAILERDPRYRDAVAFDAFKNCIMLLRAVPGIPTKSSASYPRPLSDDDVLHLMIALQPTLPVELPRFRGGLRACGAGLLGRPEFVVQG